jgi:cation diffusion facilitator family transporter
MQVGQRIALGGMVVSGALAVAKIVTGWVAHSNSVLADGFESAGDVVASGVVLLGLTVAARPPDENHPYGHGRAETLTGLLVGLMLAGAGAAISFHALHSAAAPGPGPASYAIWPLLVSIACKSVLSRIKFRYGKKLHSAALVADGWNDTVDVLSGLVALCGLGLTLSDPSRFAVADHYGGFVVGLIVITTGFRVAHDAGVQLMDTMPDESLIDVVREVACTVPAVRGVEKCYARKTGFQYHVDLHLEVDPEMSVRESHEIATAVRKKIRNKLDWVADVLVHVEPAATNSLSCQTHDQKT